MLKHVDQTSYIFTEKHVIITAKNILLIVRSNNTKTENKCVTC